MKELADFILRYCIQPETGFGCPIICLERVLDTMLSCARIRPFNDTVNGRLIGGQRIGRGLDASEVSRETYVQCDLMTDRA